MASDSKRTVDSPINEVADAVSSAVKSDEVAAVVRKLEAFKSFAPEIQQVILSHFADLPPEGRSRLLALSLEKVSQYGHKRRIVSGVAGVSLGTTFAAGGAYTALSAAAV